MSGNNAVLARNSSNAPKGMGPYSQTVALSHYNKLSEQLLIDPNTDKLVACGVKEQAQQCFKNIKAIVESIDHVMEHVVKVNILLKDMADIHAVDEVYTTFFPDGVPTWRVVGGGTLPKDALIKIDAVVSNAEGTPPKA